MPGDKQGSPENCFPELESRIALYSSVAIDTSGTPRAVRANVIHCFVDNPKILVWLLLAVLNCNRKGFILEAMRFLFKEKFE